MSKSSPPNGSIMRQLAEQQAHKPLSELVMGVVQAALAIPGGLVSIRRGYDVRCVEGQRPMTPHRHALIAVGLAGTTVNLVLCGQGLALRSQTDNTDPEGSLDYLTDPQLALATAFYGGVACLTAVELVNGRTLSGKYELSPYGRCLTGTMVVSRAWRAGELARALIARRKRAKMEPQLDEVGRTESDAHHEMPSRDTGISPRLAHLTQEELLEIFRTGSPPRT